MRNHFQPPAPHPQTRRDKQKITELHTLSQFWPLMLQAGPGMLRQVACTTIPAIVRGAAMQESTRLGCMHLFFNSTVSAHLSWFIIMF